METKEEQLIRLGEKVKKIDNANRLIKRFDFDAFGAAFYLGLSAKNSNIQKIGLEMRDILMTTASSTNDPLKDWEKTAPMSEKGKILIEKAVMVLEAILKADQEGVLEFLTPPDKKDDYINVISLEVAQDFSRLLANGKFEKKDGDKWPAANFNTVRGQVQIKPRDIDTLPVLHTERMEYLQKIVSEQVMRLEKKGHLTADVFHIICHKWLQVAQSPKDTIKITINDFLKIRGLKAMSRKKRGDDYRSGYLTNQRQLITEQIAILDNLWIKVDEMPIREKGKKTKKTSRNSRAIIFSDAYGDRMLDGSLEAHTWELSPGTVFSEFLFSPYGRMTAKMSVKAVQFDYEKEKWEKSLTTYLAFTWKADKAELKIKGKQGILVSTILNKISQPIDVRNPIRTKNRLEKALDKLEKEEIIDSWEYDAKDFNEDIIGKKKHWVKEWLQWKVIIYGPQELIGYYPRKQIKKKKKKN